MTQFCLGILCGWTMFSIIGCSIPPKIVPRVMHVASADGIAYAEVATVDYANRITGNTLVDSRDGGQTWSLATSVPPGIFQDKTQPVVQCDPNHESLCFRISQKSQVDESNDGGKTWHVGWQISPGREDYILRSCGITGCGRSGAWGPYDLSFHDQNGTTTLLVAMGEEGVLVRTADGNWQRYGVLRATPSPLQAANVEQAFYAMLIETLMLIAISVIFVPILSIGAWLVLLARMSGTPASGRRLWAMRPILVALAIAVLGNCLVQAVSPLVQGILSLVWLLTNAGQVLGLAFGYVLTWRRLATLAAQPMKVWLTGCGVFAALLIFPLGWLPLLLWAFGFLANYGVALLMALLFALVALAFALFAAGYGSVSATRQRPAG